MLVALSLTRSLAYPYLTPALLLLLLNSILACAQLELEAEVGLVRFEKWMVITN